MYRRCKLYWPFPFAWKVKCKLTGAEFCAESVENIGLMHRAVYPSLERPGLHMLKILEGGGGGPAQQANHDPQNCSSNHITFLSTSKQTKPESKDTFNGADCSLVRPSRSAAGELVNSMGHQTFSKLHRKTGSPYQVFGRIIRDGSWGC